MNLFTVIIITCIEYACMVSLPSTIRMHSVLRTSSWSINTSTSFLDISRALLTVSACVVSCCCCCCSLRTFAAASTWRDLSSSHLQYRFFLLSISHDIMPVILGIQHRQHTIIVIFLSSLMMPEPWSLTAEVTESLSLFSLLILKQMSLSSEKNLMPSSSFLMIATSVWVGAIIINSRTLLLSQWGISVPALEKQFDISRLVLKVVLMIKYLVLKQFFFVSGFNANFRFFRFNSPEWFVGHAVNSEFMI